MYIYTLVVCVCEREREREVVEVEWGGRRRRMCLEREWRCVWAVSLCGRSSKLQSSKVVKKGNKATSKVSKEGNLLYYFT
jgi:hypothetical protein